MTKAAITKTVMTAITKAGASKAGTIEPKPACGTRICACLAAAALALLAISLPARAADPIFPPGSRIGLVPPPGMVTSRTFPGFEDPDKNAAILITTLPAAAYAELEKSSVAEAFKKQGVTFEKREPIQLGFGKGFIVTGKQVTDKASYRKWLLTAPADGLTALISVQAPEQDKTYTDAAIHAALSTVAVRDSVPDTERLSLLPFTVAEMSGFHIEDVLPGRALMLVDSPNGSLHARLLIAALQGGPIDANNRDTFARLAFDEIGGIRDVHITMAEPLRIGGQAGYQTVAQAKDTQSGTDIMVVQWLRFGSGGFLQMIGIARADAWADVFNRLRAIRDGVEPK
jgi:hypothetical protein